MENDTRMGSGSRGLMTDRSVVRKLSLAVLVLFMLVIWRAEGMILILNYRLRNLFT